MKYKQITEKIIHSFFKIYNKLGYGFLEKVYENSLLIELSNLGMVAVNQVPIDVYYDNQVVGKYYADIIVEDLVIVEIKAAENLIKEHEYQLVNYLKATSYEIGLLLNFGKSPQFKRKIYSNNLLQ